MLVPPIDLKKIPSFIDWAQDNRDKIIQKVAQPAIKDACLGVVLCGLTSFFVTTNTALITLIALPVAVTVVNIYFRTMSLFCQDFGLDLPDLWKVLDLGPSLAFSIIDLATRQTVIHEGGHYFAVKLFYEKVQPTIEIFPLIGGETRWRSSASLSDWGKLVGCEKARVAVSAAGTVATQLLNIPAIIFGHYWGGQMGSYLQASAFVNGLSDATYALSALGSHPSPGSDFVALRKYGVHPLTAALTVVFIPLAIKGALLYLDQMRENSNAEKS